MRLSGTSCAGCLWRRAAERCRVRCPRHKFFRAFSSIAIIQYDRTFVTSDFMMTGEEAFVRFSAHTTTVRSRRADRALTFVEFPTLSVYSQPALAG